MPRRARIHCVSLRSSLVHLPVSIYGPLLERQIRPQNLAVHLSLVSSSRRSSGNESRKVEAYVGWTGMAAASSYAHYQSGGSSEKGLETIEIDPQYAESLGFALGDVVEIALLHDLPSATSVTAEPVTSDDWEIIEIHASHVEETLLSQVRVAVVGQEIDVWVMGRTRVRLKVVSLEPRGRAALLATNTEVSIAPKPHAKSSAAGRGRSVNGESPRPKHHIAKGKTDGFSTDKGMSEAKPQAKKRPARTMRVLPRRNVPSPTSSDASPDLVIAYVSRATLAALNTDSAAVSELHSWKATLRRLPPPADPSQDSSSSATSIPPAPRILKPNGDKGAEKPPVAQDDEVILTWSAAIPIPEGHIMLQGNVDGIEDFDLVRVSFIKEHVLLSAEEFQLEDAENEPPETKRRHGLAGVDDILTTCTQFCLTHFALHAFSGRIRGTPGLIVTGRSGAGKTSLVRAVADSMQEDSRTLAYILYVDIAKYYEAPISKIRSYFKYWMDKAAWHRPSVLILDNIDKLMGAELEHADSFRSRHIAELFLSTFGRSARTAAPNANGVILLATAESQAALHPSLNSSHLFQEVVALKPPGKDARRDILAQLVRERMNTSNIVQDLSAPLNFTALATQTEGYSATDLKDFVARAVHRAAIRSTGLDDSESSSTALLHADFASAQVDFVPLSLRDVKLQKSEVEWADVGGLRETKRVLRETLEWPTKYGPIFAQSPLRLRSGLLLYGYPGCGKTLLASAVAKECGLNFISIKGPELLNKYIGASEKSVRDLFERASAAKPCVLFFDEFDSIAPKRGHDSTGVTDRVVNQLLTQMDGAEGLEGVYVLAATSRPDLIDSALLRPGRLDKSLLCDMPNTEERREVLETLGRKTTIAPSVNLDALARDTEGFSGADLQALVYNAHLEVIHDTISSHAINGTANGADHTSEQDDSEPVEYTVLGMTDAEQARVLSRAEESAFQKRLQQVLRKPDAAKTAPGGPGGDVGRPKHEITEEHLRRVFKTTRPSVPPEERVRLERIYRMFISDRSGEMPLPPEGTDVGSRMTLM
ncbi:AAA-domain-containing protein [Laetiporus sulphureus 93-53]|uniref:Peroxisomal ATPase PEX1 n=1 Tax=Laetiporus sulphureus 93-53 TaxID=1314785 RepID=A0A165BYS7_9APHY|nr:AAA-domain-containing protein [Laetiporus sulphureus 93-53]KZT01895.1 AAA-domain-containing protein [Laetiporus sulphureus 93-53]